MIATKASPSTPTPKSYTVEEVAALLSISRSKAYQMVSRRELPGIVRVGTLLRIDRKAFDQWWADQAAGGR